MSENFDNVADENETEAIKFTLDKIVKGLQKDALTEEALTDVLTVKENTIAVVRNAIISADLAKTVLINVAGMSGKMLATKDAAFIKNMLDGLLESLQPATAKARGEGEPDNFLADHPEFNTIDMGRHQAMLANAVWRAARNLCLAKEMFKEEFHEDGLKMLNRTQYSIVVPGTVADDNGNIPKNDKMSPVETAKVLNAICAIFEKVPPVDNPWTFDAAFADYMNIKGEKAEKATGSRKPKAKTLDYANLSAEQFMELKKAQDKALAAGLLFSVTDYAIEHKLPMA